MMLPGGMAPLMMNILCKIAGFIGVGPYVDFIQVRPLLPRTNQLNLSHF